jgi:hypothetical protein
MTNALAGHFDRQYQTHLKHLKLKGLQPKTIDAYARAIRRLGEYFAQQIDDLSEAQLTENQRFQARVEFREQEILGRAIADTNAFKLPASGPESGRLLPSAGPLR